MYSVLEFYILLCVCAGRDGPGPGDYDSDQVVPAVASARSIGSLETTVRFCIVMQCVCSTGDHDVGVCAAVAASISRADYQDTGKEGILYIHPHPLTPSPPHTLTPPPPPPPPGGARPWAV